MKFLLVGHFCFDVHHPTRGSEKEHPGGIYNSASMLSFVGGRNDTIVPVCGIAKEDFAGVAELFDVLPGVSTEGLFTLDTPTNRVHVYPAPGGATTACTKDIAPPIPFEKLRRHLGSDAIILNMISGFDLTLETLDMVRIAVRDDKIPLHFDFHNLTLGVNERNERFRRPIETWRRWAFMVDTLQMNEEEICGLDEVMHDEASVVGHLWSLGAKSILITRGKNGATVYKDTRKAMDRVDIPAPVLDNADARVGQGDMLGAAFFYHMRKTGDPVLSASQAVADLTRKYEVIP